LPQASAVAYLIISSVAHELSNISDRLQTCLFWGVIFMLTQSAQGASLETHYRTIEVAGTEIFYREIGNPKSSTILLLHGFPTSSHMFRDLIPLLADRYHLIAPDYPGFGYSARPKVSEFDYPFDHLADVMEGFVDKLGLTRYALYMQDFGGPVGLRLATRRPQQVRALIIQNANAYDEGISDGVRDVVLRIWRERTPQTGARLKELFELPATKKQYLEGAPDPSLDGRATKRFSSRYTRITAATSSITKSGTPIFGSFNRLHSSCGARAISYLRLPVPKRKERISSTSSYTCWMLGISRWKRMRRKSRASFAGFKRCETRREAALAQFTAWPMPQTDALRFVAQALTPSRRVQQHVDTTLPEALTS
jgi:pimeloyl-ACP methyl ester carboxylesterase